MSREYASPQQLPRDVALAQLEDEEPRKRMDGLLSLTLYDDDWRVGQDRLELLHDPDADVVATSVMSLGDVARLHRQLGLERVMAELERLATDPALSGWTAPRRSDPARKRSIEALTHLLRGADARTELRDRLGCAIESYTCPQTDERKGSTVPK
jgi:hypothetical protein